MRRWIRWRWEARPRIRLWKGIKQRWEILVDLVQGHWSDRPKLSVGKAVKKRKEIIKDVARAQWENRPELSVRKAVKKRKEIVQDVARAQWENRPKISMEKIGKAVKKRKEIVQDVVGSHWEDRPKFKLKRSPRAHVRELAKWTRWQFKNRPWLAAAGVLVVLAGISGFIFQRQLKDLVVVLKAKAKAQEARDAAAAGDWVTAERAARESIQQKGWNGSIESLRILVEASRKRGDANALDLATTLFFHPEATLAEQTEVLAFSLDSGDVLRAQAMAAKLPEDALDDLDARYQVVRFLLTTVHLPEAVQLADRDGAGDRWAEFDLLVARALVKRGEDAFRDEVMARIARVLDHPEPESARQAMRLVGTVPGSWLSAEFVRAVVKRFDQDAGLEPEDQLTLAYLRLALAPLTRELVVTSAVADFRDDALGPLTDWLVRLREFQHVVDLTASANHPDGISMRVFSNRIRALVALKQLDTVEEELRTPPADFPEVEVLAYRAFVAERLGKDAESVVLWRQAFEKAELDPDKNRFYRLSVIAQDAGSPERQMEALAKAIEHRFGYPPPARYLEPLFAWLYGQGDTERLLSVSYRLLQREPGNPTLVNNYHYLRALHDKPDPKGPAALRRLVQADPEQPEFRATLAFVLLRGGDAQAALDTLDEIGSEPAEFGMNPRAVYAAALAALDRSEEAAALAAGIDWKQFGEEEAKILRGLTERRTVDSQTASVPP